MFASPCAGCLKDVKEYGSVAFVVDTTSSMQHAIPLVKETILNLVESEESKGSHIPKWILTRVNDPDAVVQIATESSEALKSEVEYLNFVGGGDVAEQNLLGKETQLSAVPAAVHKEHQRINRISASAESAHKQHQ